MKRERVLTLDLLTTPMFGQSLSDCPCQCNHTALGIFHAVRRAVVATKFERSGRAVQVRLGAVLIDARHAAFEYREAAFNHVGVERAATTFVGATARQIVAWKGCGFVVHVGLGKDGHLRPCLDRGARAVILAGLPSLHPAPQTVGSPFHAQNDQEDHKDNGRGVVILEQIKRGFQLLADAACAHQSQHHR